jgi:hypothetical protein
MELTISVGRARPLAALFVETRGGPESPELAGARDGIVQALAAHTDLVLALQSAELARSCEGSLGCMARASVGDGGERAPRRLLLVSHDASTLPGRLQALLLNLEKTLAILQGADQSQDGWQLTVDAKILEAAVSRVEPVAALDARDAAAIGADLIVRGFRDELGQAGDWEPWGRIRLAALPPETSVSLDGGAVASASGVLVLAQVPAGRHEIAFRHPSLELAPKVILVEGGREAALEATATPAPPYGRARWALVAGGIAAGAGGAALGTFALIRASSNGSAVCLGSSAQCSGRELVGFSSPVRNADLTQDPNPGTPIAPLALGLLVAGSVWALGTALVGDGNDAPWWQLAGGLASGALTFGLVTALDGRSAFKH